MNSNTDIARQLAEKYGIVDEGEIVELMDLESREEILPVGYGSQEGAEEGQAV